MADDLELTNERAGLIASGLAGFRRLVLDVWTSLSFKRAFDHTDRYTASWTRASDRRRLTAYKVLAAYRDNAAREHLATVDDSVRSRYREYGDAGLIVDRAVAGVLGDQVQIAVDDADADLPELPPIPTRPEAPADGADPVATAAYDAAVRVWEQRATQAIADWETSWAAQPALSERQQWLRDWADVELLPQKLIEHETNAVGLGDGVLVLGWSAQAQRPQVRVYDPGFYFPVLDDEADRRGYPTKVHIAFEEDTDGDGRADVVRRLTWELGPIEGARDPATNEIVTTEDGRMIARQGDTVAADGRIARRYRWQPDVDSFETCYYTSATWPIEAIGDIDIYDLDPRNATYAITAEGLEARRLDLRIDFVPIVHEPNTPSTQEHFGRSILARVLQILDDVASTDSDLQSAGALAGTPMVAVKGSKSLTRVVVEPGAAYNVGENGGMDVIDLSPSVNALLELGNFLIDRLSVSVQMPGEVTGRVENTGAESGFARLLKLGPYTSLIVVLRLVREHKYRIFLRFVQRLAMSGGVLDGPVYPAHLVFGSFVPADRQEIVTEVTALFAAKVISHRTALQLLMEAGIDIDDITDELRRVEQEDIEAAVRMFEATGNQDLVNQRLGIPASTTQQEPPAAPPAVNLPPVG